MTPYVFNLYSNEVKQENALNGLFEIDHCDSDGKPPVMTDGDRSTFDPEDLLGLFGQFEVGGTFIVLVNDNFFVNR